jgi:hypothetical protein
MRMITLNYIHRIGLAKWETREWWNGRKVRIWSAEHCAWWRPEGHGYTADDEQAWVLDFTDAYEATKHCGPEKRICFYAAETLPQNARD